MSNNKKTTSKENTEKRLDRIEKNIFGLGMVVGILALVIFFLLWCIPLF